jgi:hypothetical protein
MPTHEERRWITLFKGAMLEFDRQRLRERISLANDAIKQCLARIDPYKRQPSPKMRSGECEQKFKSAGVFTLVGGADD